MATIKDLITATHEENTPLVKELLPHLNAQEVFEACFKFNWLNNLKNKFPMTNEIEILLKQEVIFSLMHKALITKTRDQFHRTAQFQFMACLIHLRTCPFQAELLDFSSMTKPEVLDSEHPLFDFLRIFADCDKNRTLTRYAEYCDFVDKRKKTRGINSREIELLQSLSKYECFPTTNNISVLACTSDEFKASYVLEPLKQKIEDGTASSFDLTYTILALKAHSGRRDRMLAAFKELCQLFPANQLFDLAFITSGIFYDIFSPRISLLPREHDSNCPFIQILKQETLFYVIHKAFIVIASSDKARKASLDPASNLEDLAHYIKGTGWLALLNSFKSLLDNIRPGTEFFSKFQHEVDAQTEKFTNTYYLSSGVERLACLILELKDCERDLLERRFKEYAAFLRTKENEYRTVGKVRKALFHSGKKIVETLVTAAGSDTTSEVLPTNFDTTISTAECSETVGSTEASSLETAREDLVDEEQYERDSREAFNKLGRRG